MELCQAIFSTPDTTNNRVLSISDDVNQQQLAAKG
jgi:hypothetical protein